VASIQRDWMVQYFRGGAVGDGILAMTEMFVDRAQQAERREEFDPANLGAMRNTGVGARTATAIGEGYESPAEGVDVVPSHAQLGPVEVYEALLRAYLAGVTDVDPDMFTKESQRIFASSMPSAAAVRNMGKLWSRCRVHSVRVKDDYAVVAFELDETRRCPPKLLQREDGKWKFDLPAIRHMFLNDFENRWMMRDDDTSPYRFAFRDWRFRRSTGSVEDIPLLWPLQEGAADR